MGGYDGSNFLKVVEVYEPSENTWYEGIPLSSRRSGHTAAVIFQPSTCEGDSIHDLEETLRPMQSSVWSFNTGDVKKISMFGGSCSKYNALVEKIIIL